MEGVRDDDDVSEASLQKKKQEYEVRDEVRDEVFLSSSCCLLVSCCCQQGVVLPLLRYSRGGADATTGRRIRMKRGEESMTPPTQENRRSNGSVCLQQFFSLGRAGEVFISPCSTTRRTFLQVDRITLSTLEWDNCSTTVGALVTQ